MKDFKRLAVLATLCSQSHIAIQCGNLKHQFNKNQTTNKEGQKLKNFIFRPKTTFCQLKVFKDLF